MVTQKKVGGWIDVFFKEFQRNLDKRGNSGEEKVPGEQRENEEND